MLAILTGFWTVWAVIGVGYVAARRRILGLDAQQVLADVSFNVGSPALLFLLLLRADVRQVLAPHLAVSVLAMVCAATTYLLLEMFVLHRGIGDAVIGAFLSSYTNAANMGLPIAGYVLGDMGWMAPILLMQVIFVQPLGLAVLDARRARAHGTPSGWWRNVLLPLNNPMTLGALSGLTCNLAHVTVPPVVLQPVELVGQLSVPTLLVAFGISLAHGQRVGTGPHTVQVWAATGLKLIGMPLFAFALARLLGLDAHTTFAVTLLAGLPSAQNIFVHAVRYQQSVPLARDTIFIDTLGSIPTLMIISLLLSA